MLEVDTACIADENPCDILWQDMEIEEEEAQQNDKDSKTKKQQH